MKDHYSDYYSEDDDATTMKFHNRDTTTSSSRLLRRNHRHHHHRCTNNIIINIFILVELCFCCFCMMTTTVEASSSSSSLQDRFDISVPTFNQLLIDEDSNNNNNNYTLTYEVSDYIIDNQIARFELYDKGCKDNNDGEGEGEGEPVPISSTTILPTTLQYKNSNDNDDYSNGGSFIQLNIDIDPNKFMDETTIFTTPTESSGTLEFCVRLELVLEETIVVNFLETIIVLNIDLIGDFNVGGSNVAAKIKKEKFGNEQYGVVANFCDEYHNDFNQHNYEQWVSDSSSSNTQGGSVDDYNGGICIDGVYIDPLLEYKKAKLNSNYTPPVDNNNDDDGGGNNNTSTNSTSSTTQQRNNNNDNNDNNDNDDDDFNINEFEIEWNPKVIYNQGSVVRICVRPNQLAQENGIKMRRIEYFNFYRDDPVYQVQQKAVINGGRPAFNGLTNYFCTTSKNLCVIETILIADFYASPGTTLGEGLAHLQFGDGNMQQRRQRQRNLRTSSSSISSSSSSSWLSPIIPDNNNSGNVIMPPTKIQSEEEEELLLLLKSSAAVGSSDTTRTTPITGRSDYANFPSRKLIENENNENNENEEEVPLETLWNLTSTGFSHDGITFSLSYMLSDALTERQIQTSWLNSNCRHTINNINQTMKVSSEIKNDIIVGDDGDGLFGSQSLNINIELQPNYVSNENSNIYKETSTGNFAQIQFCLRLSLYKYYYVDNNNNEQQQQGEENIIEVNFLENPIFLNVDLQSQIGLNFTTTTTEEFVCEDEGNDYTTSDAAAAHHHNNHNYGGFLLLLLSPPRWKDVIVNRNNNNNNNMSLSAFLTTSFWLMTIQTSYFLFG